MKLTKTNEAEKRWMKHSLRERESKGRKKKEIMWQIPERNEKQKKRTKFNFI